ncbi:hypothetical protein ENUP19_0278G0047 [Entamoeba nuttalli]
MKERKEYNKRREEEILTRYMSKYETPFFKKPQTIMTKSERRKEKKEEEEGERLLRPRGRDGKKEKIEEIRRRGIERYIKIESVRKEYEKKGIQELFEWQVECLKEKGVREGTENLVYSAPTSSGKTLVSEILMIERYCQTQKKMIYIVPYVSMAQEKEEYFQEIFKSIKINIKGYFQNRVIDKEFDIGICTIEKGNGIINKLIEEKSIEEVSLIIIDEIHMIFDKRRGQIIEKIINKITSIERKIQIIGMSATIGNISIFEKWIKAKTYQSTYRPIKIEEYIVCKGKVINKEGEIKRVIKGEGDIENIISIMEEAKKERKGVICFCSTKKGCERMGKEIVKILKKRRKEEMNKEIEEQRIEMIKEMERSKFGIEEEFQDMIRYGIVYHHSGITNEERQIIEKSFKKGIITLIIATSTLALGVNLPASRVIFDKPKIGKEYLTNVQYQQMSGRAGRFGIDEKGESYIFCKEGEISIVKNLMKVTNENKEIEIEEKEEIQEKEDILEGIYNGIIENKKDIEKWIEKTLYWYTIKEKEGAEEWKKKYSEKMIEILKHDGMIEEIEEEGGEKKIKCNQIGRATVKGGMGIKFSKEIYFNINEGYLKNNIINKDVYYLYLGINNEYEINWNCFEKK